MSEARDKYLQVKNMRSNLDAAGHACDAYVSELEEIIKDKITDCDILKYEKMELEEKNKQLENEKVELIECLRLNLNDMDKIDAVCDIAMVHRFTLMRKSIDETLKKHS